MLKHLELQNFRGFQELQLTGFTRVNVITGTNGSGKTSVLEAIFLISGAANASLAASLNSFRGDNSWAVNFEVPFRTLFRDLDPDVIPRITALTSVLQKTPKKHNRQLEVKPIYSVAEGLASTHQVRKLSGVEFVFTGPSGIEKNSWGWRTDIPKSLANQLPPTDAGKPLLMLGGEPSKNPDYISAHFVSPYVRDLMGQDHKTLTTLIKQRRIPEVVKVLTVVHPSIVDIQPLMEDGVPMIYVDVGGVSLLPISLLGAGVSNVLHIILPLLQERNANILIDEFEDGLHHSLFAPLLRIIFSLATQNNNQVFISTHSDEFLRELIYVANDEKFEDIAFFRFAKRGIRGLVPKYSLAEAHDILDSNLDIR